MKNKPWLRALIIILLPLAVALIGSSVCKSGYDGGLLFLGSLAIMLACNMVFYIKKQLLINFTNAITFSLFLPLIMKLAFKSEESIWHLSLNGLVTGLIISTVMPIQYPNKHAKRK